LMSRTGVPWITSRPLTPIRGPSMSMMLTVCGPMGLGDPVSACRTAGHRALAVAPRMRCQHRAVGQMEPGQQDDSLTRRQTVDRVGELRPDHHRGGGAPSSGCRGASAGSTSDDSTLPITTRPSGILVTLIDPVPCSRRTARLGAGMDGHVLVHRERRARRGSFETAFGCGSCGSGSARQPSLSLDPPICGVASVTRRV
jgi:hypothetical protein